MTLLDSLGVQFQQQVSDIKDYVSGLPINDDQKTEICVAIRNHNLFVSPMTLDRSQVDRLNELAREVRTTYNFALSYARTLPATNDCDEYARREARNLWDAIVPSSR